MYFPLVHIRLHPHLIHLIPYLFPSEHETPWIMYACAFVTAKNTYIFRWESVGEGNTFSKGSNSALFLCSKYKINAKCVLCIQQRWTDYIISNRYIWVGHMFSINEITPEGITVGGSRDQQLRVWALALCSCTGKSQVGHLLATRLYKLFDLSNPVFSSAKWRK